MDIISTKSVFLDILGHKVEPKFLTPYTDEVRRAQIKGSSLYDEIDEIVDDYRVDLDIVIKVSAEDGETLNLVVCSSHVTLEEALSVALERGVSSVFAGDVEIEVPFTVENVQKLIAISGW